MLRSLNGTSDHHVDLSGPHYEPWLLETMLDELAADELGVGFVYKVLDNLAKRYALTDAIVVLVHETFNTQAFRLGRKTVNPRDIAHLGPIPGIYCVPDVVPEAERDAVRKACQLALSLQVARFDAAHDSLTNIANRRTFDAALNLACVNSARNGWGFTLVLIDLNDFKGVNDRSGHVYGDLLLRQFAFALRVSVRGGDTAARYGGDEFAVILNNADSSDAAAFIDRLRLNLAGSMEKITFTTGIASSPRDSTDPIEIKKIADANLYEKKGIHIS